MTFTFSSICKSRRSSIKSKYTMSLKKCAKTLFFKSNAIRMNFQKNTRTNFTLNITNVVFILMNVFHVYYIIVLLFSFQELKFFRYYTSSHNPKSSECGLPGIFIFTIPSSQKRCQFLL